MTKKKELTGKQKEVYEGLAEGKRPQEIADKMGITVNGIYGHMRRIEERGHALPAPGSPTAPPASSNGAIGGDSLEKADRMVREALGVLTFRIEQIEEEAQKLEHQREAIESQEDELARERNLLTERKERLLTAEA